MSIRQRFEEWARLRGYNLSYGDDGYQDIELDGKWDVWQAAYAAGVEDAPEVCEENFKNWIEETKAALRSTLRR